MQTKSPSLLPIVRSEALARLLGFVFVNETGATISELAAAIAVAPSTVKREVDELEAAGILTTARVGRNRLVEVNPDSPFYPELRALVLKAFGPVAVLREQFADVDGVNEAYIFGSWARRYLGERGPAPRDLDVLVVGDPDPNDVYRASADAERKLRLEVNPTIVTDAEWESEASPFLATVRRERLVPIVQR